VDKDGLNPWVVRAFAALPEKPSGPEYFFLDMFSAAQVLSEVAFPHTDKYFPNNKHEQFRFPFNDVIAEAFDAAYDPNQETHIPDSVVLFIENYHPDLDGTDVRAKKKFSLKAERAADPLRALIYNIVKNSRAHTADTQLQSLVQFAKDVRQALSTPNTPVLPNYPTAWPAFPRHEHPYANGGGHVWSTECDACDYSWSTTGEQKLFCGNPEPSILGQWCEDTVDDERDCECPKKPESLFLALDQKQTHRLRRLQDSIKKQAEAKHKSLQASA